MAAVGDAVTPVGMNDWVVSALFQVVDIGIRVETRTGSAIQGIRPPANSSKSAPFLILLGLGLRSRSGPSVCWKSQNRKVVVLIPRYVPSYVVCYAGKSQAITCVPPSEQGREWVIGMNSFPSNSLGRSSAPLCGCTRFNADEPPN